MHQPPEESVKEFEEQLKTAVITALEGLIQPPQETSGEILQARENLHAFREEDIQVLLHLLEDLQIIRKELAEYINSSSWNCHAFYVNDDDEYSIQYREYLENSSKEITPDFPTEEPDNSLNNSLPEFETFSDHTKETSSGSTTTHVDNYLPEYDSFLFEIEPDEGELTSVVMEDILREPYVHVPNMLSTHPTLMLDSDFIPSDDSLVSDLKDCPDFEDSRARGLSIVHSSFNL
uniref:Reverse transcriptase domain-containing protein n=1 Tax=Tanacetum cinerariifolium TaxID=118510 RepID=A0A699KY99_TANCI|nr:hypothetical protein [Tanacetum cinerariifolium]